MKTRQLAIYGVCVGIAMATAAWFGGALGPDEAATPVRAVATPGGQARWASDDAAREVARGEAGDSKGVEGPTSAALEALMAQAMNASYSPAEGEAAREKLRALAKEEPAAARWLMQSYDKPYFSRSRALIVSLLLEIETPEVLAFSKRLALSPDLGQQRDGFVMLQHLRNDLPGVRPIILQGLSAQDRTESVLLALAALKPPAANGSTLSQSAPPSTQAAAVVMQLQNLTRHAAPEIRVESVLQLAQWDTTGGSQAHWAVALADPAPSVREAALIAIAQSGAQSDALKAALLHMASNPRETNDVRGNAVQVLAGYALSQEEARTLGRIRSQIPGL